jgi:site-specific DNA-methyltransferase (adenine-specific)
MKIENIETNKILPYINNPRKNLNADKVASSIKEFGFQQPIVVDKEMIIIVGHTRHQAAKLLGLKTVPVVIADLPPLKAKAYRIADNRLNEDSEWDMGLLNIEFTDLLDNNFEMENLGFDDKELERLIVGDEKGLTDDDDVPELPKEPNAKLGDIYQLGEHRLMCGDSTNIQQVENLINNKKIEMLFTDPPYNVAFNGRSGKFDVIKNDNLSKDDFKDFINEFINTFKTLNINTYYICCNWAFYGILQELLNPKTCIVWAKNVFGLGKGYRHQHEFILFDGFIDASITNESDLWEIKKDSKYKHPTQKPVALSERAIKNSTKQGNAVLDLFGGSGSTLLACEKTNRICNVMELDPIYVDVIIKRWEDYTGKKAELING